MLVLEDLRSGYGPVPVLHGVTMTVHPEEVVAVVGRNGMGKTTLLKTLTGVIKPTGGKVIFDGVDVTRLPAHKRARRGIAYVPQGRDVFPQLTVMENLRVAAYASGTTDRRSAIGRVLDDFPSLAEKAQQSGGNLSGGQQQLLALARALVTDPKILLLDEPSEGIQPSLVDAITETIRTANAECGMTVVLVEQNLGFAASVATRAYVLSNGVVQDELAIQDLMESEDLQHRYLGV